MILKMNHKLRFQDFLFLFFFAGLAILEFQGGAEWCETSVDSRMKLELLIPLVTFSLFRRVFH